MKNIDRLFVYYNDRKVGTMALHKGHLAAFAYDPGWLSDGFSVSPFSLPLENRVFIPKYDPFDGIFGVFSDSLPDGWGRLIIDRLLTRNHMNPHEIGNLTRLSIIGNTGMGALSYEPDFPVSGTDVHEDYDYIASECRKIPEEKEPDDLDALFRLGGEHATMMHGNGRNPGKEDLLAVASGIGISRRKASAIADEIRECTSEMLREYLR